MDLHNNRVGQVLFTKKEYSIKEIIEILQVTMREAVPIEKPKQVEQAKKKLVFIKD
jgi:hypothetical protein